MLGPPTGASLIPAPAARLRTGYHGKVSAEQKAKLDKVLWIGPNRMSGAPCFAGTRVPVQMLIDHLKHGDTIDDFLEGAPSVRREQAELFLELASEQLVECVSS
jgi:uncharacterized protein (DUF433 family)